MVNIVKEAARRIALVDIFEELNKDGYKPASFIRAATRATIRIMGDLELALVTRYVVNVQSEDSARYMALGAVGMATAYLMDYLVFDQFWPKVTAFDKKMEGFYNSKDKKNDSQ